MHTQRMAVPVVALCALFVSVWLLPQAAASEEPRERASPLAEMTLSASRIDWLPVGDSERLVLTVAGPDGLWLRRDFEAGQPVSLSLADSEWEHLPDGTYTWELRAISPPGKLPQKSLAESGHFFVKEGSFMPARKKAPPTPQRPPRLITAESHINDHLSVTGNVCVGTSCTNTDPDPNLPSLILKAQQPHIRFDDQFVEGGNTPHDWAVFINPNSAAEFSIVDVENALFPFTIAGDAPTSSVYVASNGDLGVGTSTPGEKLHVLENVDANTFLTIENPNTGLSALGGVRAKSDTVYGSLHAHGSGRTLSRFGQSLGSWMEVLQVTGNGLIIGTLIDKPLILGTNNSNRLQISGNGNIGIGTTSPSVPLHVSRSTGAILEGIRLTNDNEARITIENTNQSTKYIMAVNNTNPALFFISRDGGGGTILEVNQRLDAGGVPSVNVNGSVQATNIIFSSSRELKERIQPLDSKEILARLARLSISEWSFKDGPQETRHIGPMAEDFNALFGTSRDTATISVTDASGVAMAAIQALLQRIEDLERRNTELAERLQALETQEVN